MQICQLKKPLYLNGSVLFLHMTDISTCAIDTHPFELFVT